MKKIFSKVLAFILTILIFSLALFPVSNITRAGDPLNLEEVQNARLEYIKSNVKLEQAQNLPGKGIQSPNDGIKIPDVVKDTPLYKSGWVKVSVSSDGLPLAEYATSKGTNVKNIDKNEAKNYVNSLKSGHLNLKNVIYSNGIVIKNVKDMYVAYNGFSAEVPVQQLERLINTIGASRVHIATLYKISDEYSNQIVGATDVWTDPGVDGTGMVVGVVDTGVDY
ncbi:MAG: hypothetical protein QXF82_07470, partial [Nitrososphaeria archaeon]